MSERLWLGLLALELLRKLKSREGPIRISELGSKYPGSVLRERLAEMAEGGLLRLEGDRVSATAGQRLELALFAIENGAEPDSVGRAMDWRGFEDFAEEVLRNMGFKCVKHLRFKGGRGRAEVDLLAIGPLFSLSIDCKRWMRANEGGILKAAEAQRRRTEELGEWLKRTGLGRAMGMPNGAILWPVVLTLLDSGIGVKGGVAIVPILKLRDFLMRADPSVMAP
ncbi:MAG: restriction endonuclease [Candidatus Bathyarchaeia archaeon]